jgi:Uma2 family endonuclease
MGNPAPRRFTLQDYWAVEMASPVRHEFLHGTIYAMAGGTPRHNEVASNLHLALGAALRGTGCHPIGADQRIRVSEAEYTYADVSVFCDRIDVAPGNPPDTATNPKILVEVLSDSTRTYDTTDKLEMYQRIPTVTEVLLVEPEEVRVVRWSRGPGGWSAETYADPAGEVPVHGASVSMAEIYARRVT